MNHGRQRFLSTLAQRQVVEVFDRYSKREDFRCVLQLILQYRLWEANVLA